MDVLRGRNLAFVLTLTLAIAGLGVETPHVRPHVRLEKIALHEPGPAKAPLEFRMVGLSWPKADPPPQDVTVRTSEDGRRWTPWTDLDVGDVSAVGGLEGPDLQSSEPKVSSSSPLWVGRARYVDVHWRGRLSSRAHLALIDPGPDPTQPPTAAYAATSAPAVISRSQWGADESIRKCCPEYAEPLQMVFIHHTATGNGYARSDSAAIVRSIYAYHVQNNGWNDIGYNFLVDAYGQIFEGRYGGITRSLVGAHTLGFNAHSAGIAVIGTFNTTAPSEAAISALERLTAWRMDIASINPAGTTVMTSNGNPSYAAGVRVRVNTISGHRDVYQTDCPGSAFYAKMGTLRSQIAPIGDPKVYSPAVTNAVLTPNLFGYHNDTTLTAQFSSAVSWNASVVDSSQKTWMAASGSGTTMSARWAARDAQGNLAPQGSYSFTLSAANAHGSTRTVSVPITVSRFPSTKLVISAHSGVTADENVWQWLLHTSNAVGSPEISFGYGNPSSGDYPVTGDWNGDGLDTIGIVRPDSTGHLVWYLRNSNSAGSPDVTPFAYGSAALGDFPVVGDWTAQGKTTIGVARPTSSGIQWLLRNSNSAGSPDIVPFTYGDPATGYPVAGDWSGLGATSASYAGVNLATGHWTWNLRDGVAGMPLTTFEYGGVLLGDVPLTGDWNGDKSTTVGVARPDSTGHVQWLLKNANTAGPPDIGPFGYGVWRTDMPVVGDWDGNSLHEQTVGVVRPAHM
jgi:hypothetical protein